MGNNRIGVNTQFGTLFAEIGGDPEDYPEIFVYLERKSDGIVVDLACAGTSSGSDELSVYLYGDTTRDEWTKKHSYSREDLNMNIGD